ncbi:dihydrolipoamide acetyltransferase family protein [Aestuariivirga litoralis]|uniref:dihydrolipoamide acetyltransferase family protein n=1 Tax=Aestuariivirga litoralis TaxID=2650924 RepID=UPI0018C5CE3C|nr:dihydrolipoamide acetyltransferase family protein [Aestuariivirga litoralis]
MPQLGETVAEGKILTWFKAVGDDVKIGDKLFEVETDKVTVEVEAIAAGKLNEIMVAEGTTVKVGSVVASLGGTAAAASASATPKPVTALSTFDEVKTPLTGFGKAKATNGIAVSPLARRLIAQNNLDLERLASDAAAKNLRRIREADVQSALATMTARIPPLSPPKTQASPLSSIRQKTGDRLAENWRTIPHVFQGIEVDFTSVDRARQAAKQVFQSAHGASLTFLPFIARATCIALRDFPNINATFDGTALHLSQEIHLGIAIDLSHRGLVVPVVKNAGDLNVEGLAKAIIRLSEKAHASKLTADDLTGGTYSITNNGAFGTMFTSPIINAPQVAILSSDAIRKRPAVISTKDGDFIAARLLGIIGQSFDHRAFDGAYAASFLSRLKQVIEGHDWSAEIPRT